MIIDNGTAQKAPATEPSFRIKAGLFPLTQLELLHDDCELFAKELKLKQAEAPSFFQQTPVVLSFSKPVFEDQSVALAEHIEICRGCGLIPVGLRGGDKALQDQAQKLNLTLIAEGRNKSNTTEAQPAATDELDKPATNDDSLAAPLPAPGSKIISSPIRSGQQVYAPGGDLIILAAVSAGAEVLADGNIHVYGPLRGRALAGVNGDNTARVFCHSMEAELVSIAGAYKLDEELTSNHWKQAVQIYLEGEKLCITPLIPNNK
jgi:septum site-determining protein MinC